MAAQRLICTSDVLINGGAGVRFTANVDGEQVSAFVVRYENEVHAYVNRCTHRGVELDWDAGQFFDVQRRFLICATHGARYRPSTGACAGGPCGGGLAKLSVIEKNNGVYLISADS